MSIFLAAVILLLLVNLFSQFIPVFRPEYINIIREQDIQFNRHRNLHRASYNKTKEIQIDQPMFIQNNSNVLPQRCEIIHIGVVCSGHKSILWFHTLMKSIYFYRNNPLHFHVMTNKASEEVLKVLFKTWAIPQVTINFYDINNFLPDVRWVPNFHYSGIYGLLKLTYPKAVPLNVTKKIIVIDTDIIFTGDIYYLWDCFTKFKEFQVLGLVENESNYYLKDKIKIWPAVGRGFNTGVILYHLENIKKVGWDALWNRVAKKTVTNYGSTRLADQDIINAIIKQEIQLLFQVPCQWNTQLSDLTLSYNCYSRNDIKIIHWNSPKKFDVVNKDGDYFRSIYTLFLEMNGNLFRRQLFHCEPNNKISNSSENYIEVCSEFQQSDSYQWRTLLFFQEQKFTPLKNDVTFVAHLSYDRLYMIEDLCKYWKGPISLTFYLTDPEFQKCLDFIKKSEVLQDRTNIAYHVVFKEGQHYPINELRNVGLQHVITPYVFLADVDFIPMTGLYEILKRYLGTHKALTKEALIVPAFETQRYRTRIPKNKRELLHMLETKSIFTFRYDVWPIGHKPINYNKWKVSESPYEIKWQPDFEPYIVVSKDVVKYDRRFLGFGWNKVSHIMELAAQNYKFTVLPNVFIIHKPHAPSYDIGKFRNSPIYRMCLQNLKDDFVEQLQRKYGKVFVNVNGSFVKVEN